MCCASLALRSSHPGAAMLSCQKAPPLTQVQEGRELSLVATLLERCSLWFLENTGVCCGLIWQGIMITVTNKQKESHFKYAFKS